MRRIACLALAFASTLLPLHAQERAGYADYVKGAVEGYIRPETRAFANAATRLPTAVEDACKSPGTETADEFRVAYGGAVAAFGRISFLRYGPLAEESRLERIAFLPDARGVAQRQIRKLVAERDESATTPESLAAKSVAVQGLTALQLAAFDDDGQVTLGGTDEAGVYACAYAQALAVNLAQLSGEVAALWEAPDGFSGQLEAAGPDNPRFRNSKEAAETLFNALVTGLVIVRDQDVIPAFGPALGNDPASAKPNRIPFSRANFGQAYIASELTGIRDFIRASNYAKGVDSEGEWIAASLEFEVSNSLKALARAGEPMRETVKTPEGYKALSDMLISLKGLRDLVALNLAGSLDMTGGFNALDGD
ncbi:imelysin family protein [Pannonibacter indicus]|uniref:Predicted periplasmic lipoprotein n=1 Tax=Pannonibacter indicus TaxID=466044 RepID=A0A0K6I2D0_9HYPH|nr:imelysin family protein [Pannonibacter indicus]CUA97236.1 Predicted periplasmic lipoprotein [Pannonibacter indicus]